MPVQKDIRSIPARKQYSNKHSRRRFLTYLAAGSATGLIAAFAIGVKNFLEEQQNLPFLKKIDIEDSLESELNRDELDSLKFTILEFIKVFELEGNIKVTKHADPNVMFVALPGEIQINIENIRREAEQDGAYTPSYLRAFLLPILSKTRLISHSANVNPSFKLTDEEASEIVAYQGFNLIKYRNDGGFENLNSVEVAFNDYFARSIDRNYSDRDELSNLAWLMANESRLSPQSILGLYSNHNILGFIGSVTKGSVSITDLTYFLELFERAMNGENAQALFAEFKSQYGLEG